MRGATEEEGRGRRGGRKEGRRSRERGGRRDKEEWAKVTDTNFKRSVLSRSVRFPGSATQMRQQFRCAPVSNAQVLLHADMEVAVV